jgi:hypothetical protein
MDNFTFLLNCEQNFHYSYFLSGLLTVTGLRRVYCIMALMTASSVAHSILYHTVVGCNYNKSNRIWKETIET